MPARTTTPGRLALRQALPEQYHHYLSGPLDRGRLDEMMKEIAQKEPERYEEILHKLTQLGDSIGSTYGREASLSPSSFEPSEELVRERLHLKKELMRVQQSDMPMEQKEDSYIAAMQEGRERIKDAVAESIKGTSFEAQLASGVRGNIDQVTDILAGEIIPVGPNSEPLPHPIDRGWESGLTPSQYWLHNQKARKGLIGTKLATPAAGDISNQIRQAVQRLRITAEREPEESQAGLPVDPSDSDYTGSILAADVEDLAKRGDKLTPELAREMKDRGIQTVLIHSPITSQVPAGVSWESIGDSTGVHYTLGDFAGNTAAESLTERLSQISIGSKHRGQSKVSGSELIEALIDVPKDFPHEAALSGADGMVQEIHTPEVGDGYIKVNGERYRLPAGEEPTVEKGEEVRKGQRMSSGVVNPSHIVDLLGVGEGRRRYAQELSEALKAAGIDHNKRNAEFIARGLVNHARITEPYEDWVPGDLVEHAELMRRWQPREDSYLLGTSAAQGKYLEKPVAHYTPGTKLSRSMVGDLKDLGYRELTVHDQPPPFKPEMRRAREARQHAENWVGRLGGSHLRRSFMRSLEQGRGLSDAGDPTAVFTQILTMGKPQPVDGQGKIDLGKALSA